MSDIHICPTSNEKFYKLCPIKACPANISHIKGREPGCAHILLKKDLGKHELSFLFKKPAKEIEQLAINGNERIRAAMFMERIAPMLKYEGPTCQKCFVSRPSVGNCLNTQKCKERTRLAKRLLKKFPFNHPHFKFNATKLFTLGKKRKEISDHLMPWLMQNGISVYDLLKIKRRTFEKLESYRL